MQINFKDFQRASKMLGLSQGPMEDVVTEVNNWITSHQIDVVNLETINGTSGGGSIGLSLFDKGIRVWYRVSA